MGCACGGSTPPSEQRLTPPQQRAQQGRERQEAQRAARAAAARPVGARRPALEGIYWNGPPKPGE